MLSAQNAHPALTRLFQKRRIADLKLILATLKTTSPMSAFRRLSELSYITSYSHARQYYTLTDIPQFDADGRHGFPVG
jgi:hypothetical protein